MVAGGKYILSVFPGGISSSSTLPPGGIVVFVKKTLISVVRRIQSSSKLADKCFILNDAAIDDPITIMSIATMKAIIN